MISLRTHKPKSTRPFLSLNISPVGNVFGFIKSNMLNMNYEYPLNPMQNVPLSKCNKPCKKIIQNAKWKWWKDAQQMKVKRGMLKCELCSRIVLFKNNFVKKSSNSIKPSRVEI